MRSFQVHNGLIEKREDAVALFAILTRISVGRRNTGKMQRLFIHQSHTSF